MTLTPLVEIQALHGGATHVAELTYADLTTAGTGQTTALASVLNRDGVRATQMELVTPFVFSDVAVTNLSVVVGDGGSTNRFVTATELASVATEVNVKGGALSAPYQYTADDTVDIVLTSTGGNLNTATAGKVLVYLALTPNPVSQLN